MTEGLSLVNIIFILLGAAALIVWIIFFVIGRKYKDFFGNLQEKEFPLKEIYGTGYAVLELFKYKYKSKNDRKLRQNLEVLYEKKYSEYYLRVIHAQQITMAMTIVVISFALYGLGDSIAIFIVGLIMAGVAYYYFGTTAKKRIQKRSEELLREFSEVVSKLALLTNAGMIMKEAWEKTAFAGEGLIYEEMRRATDEMNNGVADVDAIYTFGLRCMLPEIKKFSSTIIQGLTKGNRELVMMLQEQSSEVWELKKQLVHREGEKAASKLLIPIAIMFIGILILILIPIFTNLGI